MMLNDCLEPARSEKMTSDDGMRCIDNYVRNIKKSNEEIATWFRSEYKAYV